MGAYGSSVMQSAWPRLALSSYGEGANMAQKGRPVTSTRVKRKEWPPKVVSLSGNAQKGEKQRETAISGRLSVRNHDM